MNRLRAFSPHCEMNGFGANVLLRTVDAYHRRLESLFLPPNHPSAQHCVDRHAQYFSLLRKGLVYSAGNDPNPADICPTGRGALTQVCHFISTVKSIKSTHTEGLFFHACTVFVSFFFFLFLFFGGGCFFFDENLLPGTKVYTSAEMHFGIAWWGNPKTAGSEHIPPASQMFNKCTVQYSTEGTRTQQRRVYGLDTADAISTSISLDSICSSK